jgi:hypothetical protein
MISLRELKWIPHLSGPMVSQWHDGRTRQFADILRVGAVASIWTCRREQRPDAIIKMPLQPLHARALVDLRHRPPHRIFADGFVRVTG